MPVKCQEGFVLLQYLKKKRPEKPGNSFPTPTPNEGNGPPRERNQGPKKQTLRSPPLRGKESRKGIRKKKGACNPILQREKKRKSVAPPKKGRQ